MGIMEYCSKHVITASENLTVLDAAKEMRNKNVGSIVVIDFEKKPIGMVSDRDIVVKVTAQGKDPTSTFLKDVMSKQTVVLRQDQGVFEATKLMSEKGIRRIPVVDSNGKLEGIVCLDDLIMLFAEEVENIANAIAYGTSRAEAKNFTEG
jgi:CBS domain-containing protein